MFQLMVHLFNNYASFTNAMFGQLLSNCSRYAANLNMKAVSFFTHTVQSARCYTITLQYFVQERVHLQWPCDGQNGCKTSYVKHCRK